MVRNPKDVVVSYYNFFKKMKEDEFDGTMDDCVDIFCEGQTVFGSFWDHIHEYEGVENVHFVHYEDLIEVCCFYFLVLLLMG